MQRNNIFYLNEEFCQVMLESKYSTWLISSVIWTHWILHEHFTGDS